ncbi:ATP-binding protein [Rhizobium sp. Root651]|uniref:ATP-binding protein n=1 Tax=Rhizobium sp. Root651 TaxID=1736577 RepID=UPI000714988E|nr:ATP-binding protein [Rhizobium sp. Root651]KRA65307.1 hypothetical protein ASD85_25480 [Rhizobium sp. Root651]
MLKARRTIADFLNVPARFLRSAQLEKDFHDTRALENYIVTPAMAAALLRITDGLRDGSSRRAWRVTGDYGVGKSSFALVLAHLLAHSPGSDTARIADSIGWTEEQSSRRPLWPILITGSREGIVDAIARGIGENVEFKRGSNRNGWDAIDKALEDCRQAATARSLERLLEALRAKALNEGMGIVLIVDELGKLLEYAAQNPDGQDVFALQRLAELASRSNDQPFLLLGILHQGFQAYAERLPAAVRHEWDKVAGRFEEIVFDQPLAHTAALIAGALGTASTLFPPKTTAEAREAANAAGSMGWLGGATSGIANLDAAQLYPLHPTLLPPLVRFFARFGQHERSLFGFLLSSEPFGLQAFAEQTAIGDGWYNLADFYDYVRASFGHRLSGASYQSHWLRIVSTIDTATEIDILQIKVLKAVGILNLLDADDLVANERSLKACFSTEAAFSVNDALKELTSRGLLFKRGERGGYRLWPNSSVNLHAAMQNARRAVPEVDNISGQIAQFLDTSPILARRHYIESGTMRYFEVRHVQAEAVEKSLLKATNADGVVLLVLADTDDHRQIALDRVQAQPSKMERNVIVGVLQPLASLGQELAEVKRWQWIEDHTPELLHDEFAAAEVSRQLHEAKRLLSSQFVAMSGLSRRGAGRVEWWSRGEVVKIEGTLSNTLSKLCDGMFPLAPRIANELINRNMLSSAAASARMRLIEGIFGAGDKPLLGIETDKAPPEKSMYLSVLQAGGIHVEKAGRFDLVEPDADHDPLILKPALSKIIGLIKGGKGHRISVPSIFHELKNEPYGVRDGLAPLLLALVLKIHSHELAVYEAGTFLARFGAHEFLRLSKAAASFEIQYCSVEGVRSEVFSRLAEAFTKGIQDRRPVLLDVVQELCQFAAKLPEYTRKSKTLSPMALAVREALMAAREPATLLFQDLPKACGLEPFDADGGGEYADAERFVINLNSAVNDLQGAYTQLLERIVLRVAEASGLEGGAFHRADLAGRASRVSLAAREPRLRAFALRLRDPGLSDDAWAEALASFVVARPPSRWMPGDEVRFGEEIGALAELFAKVEAAAFSGNDDRPAVDAIRLNLTRGDGQDLVRVLQDVKLSVKDQPLLDALAASLPQGEAKRIQFLTNLLWLELEKTQPDAAAATSDRADLAGKFRK